MTPRQDDSEEEMLDIESQLGDYFGELEVSEENISEQISKQPSNFVYYARVAALAKRKMLKKDLELKRFEAQASRSIRLAALGRGEKLSVQAVEDEMRGMSEWKKLNEELIEMKANLDLAEGIKEGFFQRKSMIEEVAKSLRKEADMDSFFKKKMDDYKESKRNGNR